MMHSKYQISANLMWQHASLRYSIVYVAASLFLCSFTEAREGDSDWEAVIAKDKLSGDWETKGNWQIRKKGVLELVPRPGEEGWRRFDAYLWSKRKYRDFEMDFEYMFKPEGNSGFFFCVGDKANPVENGIEVQLMDPHGTTDETPLNDHDAGGFIPSVPPKFRAAKPAGNWNRMRVTAKKSNVTVWINDKKVNEIKLPHLEIKDRPLEGFLGFQDHGMPLFLRNVRVRTLD